MPGKLADVTSGVNVTLGSPDGWTWGRVIATAAIIVSASPGSTLTGAGVAPGATTYALPAGKTLVATHNAACSRWYLRQLSH
jgi:hypothetical protein